MNFLFSLCWFVLSCAVSSVRAQPYLEVKARGIFIGGVDNECKILTECVMTCDITVVDPVSVGTPIALAPSVSWERFVGEFRDGSWWRLSDEIWSKQYRIQYSTNRGHSLCTGGNGSYHCEFIQPRCCSPHFNGIYRCNIAVSHVMHKIYQSKEFALNPFHYTNDECSMPTVQHFTAEHNSTNSTIMLRWDTALDGDPCYRSKRFMVSVSVFDSHDDYLRSNPFLVSAYVSTAMRRDKYFTMSLSEDYTLNRYYEFRVQNQHLTGNASASVSLEVVRSQVHVSEIYFFGQQVPARLVAPASHTTNIRVRSGREVTLRCEATGSPVPTTSLWFKDSFVQSQSDNTVVIQKELVVTPESAGLYKCSASNVFVRPTGGAFPAFSQKFINLEVYEMNDSDVLCSLIEQSSCASFLSEQRVIFNTSDVHLQGQVESIVSVLRQAMESSNPLETECLTMAHAITCHSSFPFCYNDKTPRKVCKSMCDLFRPDGACASVIGQLNSSEVHRVIFSNCDGRISPAGSKPECIHVPFREEIAPSWCHSGDGRDYAGQVIRTSSNSLCQDWISEQPHRHPLYSSTEINSATNQCRNPGGTGTRPWCYTVDRQKRWEYCDVPRCEVCESYKGQFCKDFPGYDRRASVYLNRHESEWTEAGQTAAEVWMLTEFISIFTHQLNIPVSCSTGIKEMICHNTLPLCHTSSGGSPVPMKLCSSHCKASKLLQVCPGEVIRRLQEDKLESGYTFPELQCIIETESNRDCIPTQTLSSAAINVSDTVSCYNVKDSGKGYVGKVSRSFSGALCQPWAGVLPGAENYCRNPHQLGERLWCFTDAELTQWEYCDVPACAGAATQDFNALETDSDDVPSSSNSTIVIISVLIVLVLLGIGVFLAIIVGLYFYKKNLEASHQHLFKLSPENSVKCDLSVNEKYSKVETEQQPLAKSPKLAKVIEGFRQIEKSSLRYIRQLGQGNFGVVFFAKAEGLQEDEKETPVAVKTLKEETCSEALEDFVREAKLMFNFDHPNVIKIFAVSMESVPYYLIFEFMDRGDLTQFLRANASSLQQRLMNPLDERSRSRTDSTLSDDPPSLNFDQLTDMCKQIANGMKYLADEKHVHRDLACRNCLVKSNDELTESGFIIKIGDFGMSHNLYNADYYRVKGSAVLPVRWMSPEAIVYGKFSTESDVWSFGVVMWEVFSFAMQPYYGTSNEEVTEYIRRHKILKKPDLCPNSIYEIMKLCWNQDPAHRPTFEELCTQLDESLGSISSNESPYIDDSNSSDLDSDAFLEENSVDGLDAAL